MSSGIKKSLKALRNAHFGRGSFKPLIFAAFLALNLNAAKAKILPSVAEDFPKGTLDNLEGQTIPGSNPEQTYPSSGYSLYKIQEGGDKPNYFNVVTKFTYNTETGEITPVYYAWDLKNGTFGDGENSVYYGWNRDEETGMIGFIGSEEDIGLPVEIKYDIPDVSEITPYPIVVNPDDDTYSENPLDVNIFGQEFQTNGSTITNHGKISSINAYFVNNSNRNTNNNFIDNSGEIGDITAQFYGNSQFLANGALIRNNESAIINSIKADFVANTQAGLSSIINNGEITNGISGNFIANQGAGVGAIYNQSKGFIGNITANFIGNIGLQQSGGIYNGGTIGNVTGDFISNQSRTNALNARGTGKGGAIKNEGIMGAITGDFINNSAVQGTGERTSPAGGAIYS